jgi:hypothetical protein
MLDQNHGILGTFTAGGKKIIKKSNEIDYEMKNRNALGVSIPCPLGCPWKMCCKYWFFLTVQRIPWS